MQRVDVSVRWGDVELFARTLEPGDVVEVGDEGGVELPLPSSLGARWTLVEHRGARVHVRWPHLSLDEEIDVVGDFTQTLELDDFVVVLGSSSSAWWRPLPSADWAASFVASLVELAIVALLFTAPAMVLVSNDRVVPLVITWVHPWTPSSSLGGAGWGDDDTSTRRDEPLGAAGRTTPVRWLEPTNSRTRAHAESVETGALPKMEVRVAAISASRSVEPELRGVLSRRARSLGRCAWDHRAGDVRVAVDMVVRGGRVERAVTRSSDDARADCVASVVERFDWHRIASSRARSEARVLVEFRQPL